MRSLYLLPLLLATAGCCHRHAIPDPLPPVEGQVQAELWVGYTFVEPNAFGSLEPRTKEDLMSFNRDVLHDVNLGCGPPWEEVLASVGIDVDPRRGLTAEAFAVAVNDTLDRLETGLRVFSPKFQKHECINGHMWCKVEFDLYRFEDGVGWELLTSDFRTPNGPLHSVYDVTVAFRM